MRLEEVERRAAILREELATLGRDNLSSQKEYLLQLKNQVRGLIKTKLQKEKKASPPSTLEKEFLDLYNGSPTDPILPDKKKPSPSAVQNRLHDVRVTLRTHLREINRLIKSIDTLNASHNQLTSAPNPHCFFSQSPSGRRKELTSVSTPPKRTREIPTSPASPDFSTPKRARRELIIPPTPIKGMKI